MPCCPASLPAAEHTGLGSVTVLRSDTFTDVQVGGLLGGGVFVCLFFLDKLQDARHVEIYTEQQRASLSQEKKNTTDESQTSLVHHKKIPNSFALSSAKVNT